MVINETQFPLRAYFEGPVARQVTVPRRSRRPVALIVGTYEIAVEVIAPGHTIVPLLGRERLRPRAHYWLFLRVVQERRRR